MSSGTERPTPKGGCPAHSDEPSMLTCAPRQVPRRAPVHNARRPRRPTPIQGRRSRRASPAHVMDRPSPSWRLVLIAELLRQVEQLHLEAMRLLAPETCAEIADGTVATMAAAEIEQLVATLADGAEMGEQIRLLAQVLPGEDIEIAYEDVRDAAAVDLAAGVLDPERALIAARVLDVGTGWPALAEGLRALDVRDGWGARTPRALLSEFRGAGRQLVAQAAQRAGLVPERTFEECSAEELARLADAIDGLGRAWPRDP